MCDYVGDFSLYLGRKLHFGVPYFKIPPIPKIALQPGRTYEDPLDTMRLSSVGMGLLYLQFLKDFKSGEVVYGFDMPRSEEFMYEHLSDIWRENLVNRDFAEALINATETSSRFLEKFEEGGPDFEESENRHWRSCFVIGRIMACVVLRRLFREPPVEGMVWDDWKSLSVLGPGGLYELVYSSIPAEFCFKETVEKRWFMDEIGAFVSATTALMDAGRVGPRALQEAVLYAIGSHPIAGGHSFVFLKENSENLSKPCIPELHELEEGDPFVVIVNARGMHVCDFATRRRLKSIPYNGIIRWSGSLKTLTLTVGAAGEGFTERVVKGVCYRATLFRQIMLELIHSLMTHQGQGIQDYDMKRRSRDM